MLQDGTNVNHELVKEGWCWWYRKDAREAMTSREFLYHVPCEQWACYVTIARGRLLGQTPSVKHRQADPPLNSPPDQLLLSVSQLTEHPGTVGYCAVMRQMDFYFHDGCLSQQSVLLLAREIEQDRPDWRITIHPLLGHEATALGFHVLPTIVMNGCTVIAGVPKKDWLLERMKECERARRDPVD